MQNQLTDVNGFFPFVPRRFPGPPGLTVGGGPTPLLGLTTRTPLCPPVPIAPADIAKVVKVPTFYALQFGGAAHCITREIPCLPWF